MATHARRGSKSKPKATAEEFASICGIYWEGSAWYGALNATCEGQGEAQLGKVCPVYACAKQRGLAHCGLCDQFPCILLVHMAAQSGHDDIRIFSAARRAELGDEVWAQWVKDQKLWTTAYCPLRSLQVQRP